MDRKLKELLKENNLSLQLLPIEGRGYLVPTPPDEPNLIFVSSKLSDEEVTRVVLHELGHYKYDHTVLGDYKNNRITKFCSECKANRYMVNELIKYYVALGHDVRQINYVNLARYIGVSDPAIVKKELAQYI